MPLDHDLDNSLDSVMRDLTTAFFAHIDVNETLAHLTATAVAHIEDADYADFMLINGGRFASVAPTAPLIAALDRTQMQHRQGPCLEAAVADSVIRSADLRQERRWPAFADEAIESGVHSVLSFQLYTHAAGAGAFNVLSKKPHAFDMNAETGLAMLATHGAITLIAADKETQFHSALASRDLIGQAKGIIMERFQLDAQRAFDLLAKLSQDTNTPVRSVASQLVASLVQASGLASTS
jgi:transcriptional regulator with GAF, ATPase, and Fis domain